jgi:hypothetical protein
VLQLAVTAYSQQQSNPVVSFKVSILWRGSWRPPARRTAPHRCVRREGLRELPRWKVGQQYRRQCALDHCQSGPKLYAALQAVRRLTWLQRLGLVFVVGCTWELGVTDAGDGDSE